MSFLLLVIIFQFRWIGVLLRFKERGPVHILLVWPVLATIENNEAKYPKECHDSCYHCYYSFISVRMEWRIVKCKENGTYSHSIVRPVLATMEMNELKYHK